MIKQQTSRREKAYVSILGTTQIHLRNPLVIASWSAAFPGLGHLLLSKYIRGFLLFFWEVFINYQANLNEAIYYSFVGDIDKAKVVLNKEWLLLYISTYLFAVWDAYRTAVDINNLYELAAREDAEIKSFRISALEINYADKRKPYLAFIWSMLMPGLGQVYIHRIVTAFFALAWWVSIAYMSKIIPAIHYSFLGQFEKAKEILNIQWTLNFPSIYGFAIYDAYINTVENNKLYNWDQAKFLKKQYQSNSFVMPKAKKITRGEHMYIIGTFQFGVYLEKAVTALEMMGILKENILVSPIDKRGEKRRVFDTIHYSDGLSLLDLGVILGAIFMLFGTIYGFELEWGPIWWALIGAFSGFALGVIIKLIATKKFNKDRMKQGRATEVVVIIECQKDQANMVKEILWENYALGASLLDKDNEFMIQ